MENITTEQLISKLKTPRDFTRWGTSQFNRAKLFFGHGFTNAWDEALYLVRHVLHLTPSEDAHVADARLLPEERLQILQLFERRIKERKPAAYLTQEAWFANLSFYVDERVIIPRSPIAELIEQEFYPWATHSVERILDLCTGSACIAIASSLTFPKAQVDAVDISEGALAVAKRNVSHYGLENSVHLIQSDLFNSIPPCQYDIIVCNPPYVDAKEMAALPSEFRHEPKLALEAGEDGLDLVTRILNEANNYLSPEGILVVEVGASAAALQIRFPNLPFIWVPFERGGEGVFVLKKEEKI